MEIALILAVIGGAPLGFNALRLPSWAAEREEQMSQVAARARALLGAAPEEAASAAATSAEAG